MKPSAEVYFDALKRNEVAQFLLGRPSYFVDGNNDNDEPQNVNEAFNFVMLAAWRQTGD